MLFPSDGADSCFSLPSKSLVLIDSPGATEMVICRCCESITGAVQERVMISAEQAICRMVCFMDSGEPT